MITITPQGNVYLCNVPLEQDYKNQLTFTDSTNQQNYFNSHIVKSYDNYTYLKKDNVIKVGENIDEIIGCNYLFYRNNGFTNRIYYCFITNKEYINENCTALTIETDVFQTYQFDMNFDYSFVEREHVEDDTVGLHTIPEGLETGDYICNSVTSLYSGGNATYTCIAVSSAELPTEMAVNQSTLRYNGIFSGVAYVFFDTSNPTYDYLSAGKFINLMDTLGKGDAISSIFLVPTTISGTLTFTKYTVVDGNNVTREIHACVSPASDSATVLGTVSSITSPATLNGYTPRNNKLKVYPYNYFYISNNVGSNAEFHYEDFISNTASFKTVGSITPGCSIKCFPLNYNKLQDSSTTPATSYSYNYGIVGAKYPMCSWTSDSYLNWLTQNGINIGGHYFNAKEVGIFNTLYGGLKTTTSNIANADYRDYDEPVVPGIVEGIIGTMVENYQRDLMPNSSSGSLNSGDVTYSFGKMDIPLYKMSIRYEYAVIIDKFFDLFGYKVNELKIPNLTSRPYWNFIKTQSCEIHGDIPQEHLSVLKSIFDKGITLWHDASHYLDYSQNNAIVTPSV